MAGLFCLVAPADSVASGEASGVAPRVELSTPTVRPGGVASLDVATEGLHTCALSFRGPAGAALGPFRVASHGRHLRWSWRVARDASSGVWVATVACAQSRAELGPRAARVKEDFVVKGGHGHTQLFVADALRVHVSRLAPTGAAAPTGGKVVGLGGAGNPFPYGQCTYHAFETRPDIYEYAVAHGVPRGGLASGVKYGGYPDYWWNAWRWLGNAQRVGYPTGTTPIPKALVVFPRGYGGSAVGHVAYVESVNADGSYYVSERNWNYNSNVTKRLVPAGVSGVGFIYGGPAGSGPAAPKASNPPTTLPPTTSPPTAPPGTTPPASEPNRTAITSYNRVEPGAPYHGVFEFAWERFTAASNTITQLGATVGNSNYAAGQPTGLAMTIRLCTAQPASNGACAVLGETAAQVVNYGATLGDIGDVSVTPGATYYIEYFPPQPYGNGWVTFWWAGGSTITSSEQLQALVRGYNR
ncbi:MAG TPA: CHAP domain-containing protein [Solirubrobacteraceae bacterium]|jgi:surface antigen